MSKYLDTSGTKLLNLSDQSGAAFDFDALYQSFVQHAPDPKDLHKVIKNSKLIRDAAKVSPQRIKIKLLNGKDLEVKIQASPDDNMLISHKRLMACVCRYMAEQEEFIKMNPLAESYGLPKTHELYHFLVSGYEFLAPRFPAHVAALARLMKQLMKDEGKDDAEIAKELQALARQKVNGKEFASALKDLEQEVSALVANTKLVRTSSIQKRSLKLVNLL